MITLTPDWVEVNRTETLGWYLNTGRGEIHRTASIDVNDDRGAQSWANGILGAPRTWRRVTGSHGRYCYQAA